MATKRVLFSENKGLTNTLKKRCSDVQCSKCKISFFGNLAKLANKSGKVLCPQCKNTSGLSIGVPIFKVPSLPRKSKQLYKDKKALLLSKMQETEGELHQDMTDPSSFLFKDEETLKSWREEFIKYYFDMIKETRDSKILWKVTLKDFSTAIHRSIKQARYSRNFSKNPTSNWIPDETGAFQFEAGERMSVADILVQDFHYKDC